MGRAAAEERGEGGKILRIPTPEAQKSPGEQVTGWSPQTCQRVPPLFTWLEARSERLLEPDHGCPPSTLTRTTPPPSLPPGAVQPARSKC
ncbi:unnamed protein product [Rangifer tarandus platyrhynchus]|uniref:Uncharacterized protein n=2 Tax=Rangifer tarandus platyrhynchus TaxID=3082113 RepID=A0ABN8Y3G6_RANTA|nr:unnamed protein product [Rangifer tarandus platyrhynchus]CAI9693471.1 unnamed protein product [Rangifer tarandus platyrhynchus]